MASVRRTRFPVRDSVVVLKAERGSNNSRRRQRRTSASLVIVAGPDMDITANENSALSDNKDSPHNRDQHESSNRDSVDLLLM